MKKLKYIIQEVERAGKEFRETKNKLMQNSYEQYIKLIITEAPRAEQYNLCDYWARWKNE